ncbi:MAG: flavodoxin family protein [Candidatus Bathyarchaeota archaeon]|nr:flavodoxin family protein [Candidatus Bathyarchaeota archaeon]
MTGITMKVVGVIGGAKRDGNTYKLVKAALDGALEAGHTTVTWRLMDVYIGHLGHFADEILPPIDDFEKMQPDLESMGALVLGSPIWYGHVDTRTFNFINRTYVYNRSYSEENAKKWPNAKAVNILTYETEDEHTYDHILEWYNHIWDWYGMKESIGLVAAGTTKKPVAEQKELIERAKEIGRNL